MRTNTSRTAANGTESLPVACRRAINGAAPLFRVGFDYPRRRRKYNLLADEQAKSRCGCPVTPMARPQASGKAPIWPTGPLQRCSISLVAVACSEEEIGEPYRGTQ